MSYRVCGDELECRKAAGKRSGGGVLQESCKYLDGLEWVQRYAWFGAMREGEMGAGGVGKGAALLDGEGRLTGLGNGIGMGVNIWFV